MFKTYGTFGILPYGCPMIKFFSFDNSCGFSQLTLSSKKKTNFRACKLIQLRKTNSRVRSLVVSNLCLETKISRFESDCDLCAEVSSLQ